MSEAIAQFDSDENDGKCMRIFQAGNGDWYLSTGPADEGYHEHAVRICTSGGAAFRFPGLTESIAEAYYSLRDGGIEGALRLLDKEDREGST